MMTARNGASIAHFIALCGGSYFLGVATAIGLVYLDSLSDDWKFRVAITVALMAAVLLSTGVVQFIRQPRADARAHSRRHDTAASRRTTGKDGSDAYRDERMDARNAAGVGRDVGSFSPNPGESTPDLAPPGRPDSVVGVEASTDPPEPPSAVEPKPEAAAELHPASLIHAWDAYRRTGDGHFKVGGLQRVLDERGIRATVGGGDLIDVGGSMLIIETPAPKGHFYVLPSFAKSPRAVADWFDDRSSGALTGRTERVVQIAEGRWTGSGFEVVRRGEVV